MAETGADCADQTVEVEETWRTERREWLEKEALKVELRECKKAPLSSTRLRFGLMESEKRGCEEERIIGRTKKKTKTEEAMQKKKKKKKKVGLGLGLGLELELGL